MVGNFSHVGILVRDLDATVNRYCSSLGARILESAYLSESKTDVVVLELGGIHLELLSSKEPDSKVGLLLRERGEGMHHLSFAVEDIRAELAHLRGQGVGLLDESPRSGLHGRQIAFLAPASTAGVLIELAEENKRGKT
jgi:methylmalonyl-CoA epimerase